ncbi:MAG: sugar phosphate isomerase/epimerase family protein [Planctomycetia bacterium]|nr:sugar phosphate isomerase/epimerase family protein [Planctomycetia bacterium]
MDRRNFLLAGVAASTTGVGALQSIRADEKSVWENNFEKARLRFACYWGRLFPAESDSDRLEKMRSLGMEAIEISGNGEALKPKKQMFDDAGFEVCSISVGAGGGALVSEDPSRRQSGIDAVKKALENAAFFGAKAVVYVPAFNGVTKLEHVEIRKILIETLPALGEFAVQHGTHLVMEPLCRSESWFLRRVGDAAQIAKETGSEGIATMGDFYHMAQEETSDMGAFIAGGKFIKHVHLGNGPQPPKRTLPGEDDRTFADGFRGLKYIGYDRFCSFECGVHAPDKLEAVRRSIAYCRAEWERADVWHG